MHERNGNARTRVKHARARTTLKASCTNVLRFTGLAYALPQNRAYARKHYYMRVRMGARK